MAEILYFDRGIPSNFYRGAPFVLYLVGYNQTVDVATSEHGFQFLKALWFGFNSVPILQAGSPGEAKRLGGELPMTSEMTHSWDTQLALPAMMSVNIAKFHQNHTCSQWLLQTGDAHLVERRPDRIWGNGMDGRGKNLLGRVLELVRVSL